MIIRVTFALFICLLLSILTTPSNYAANIKRLVIFGDSLSDQGRMYEFSHDRIPVSPPYWYGRFSNGPVWTDIISDRYAIKNLSEGGATVVNYAKYSLAIKYLYITYLGEEITDFLKSDAFLPTDLVIIWLGGNDYITYNWLTQEDIERATRELYLEVLRIKLKGAEQVLVINLPDMSETPLAKQEKNIERLHLITMTHNQLVEETLSSSLSSEFIKIYDAFSVFKDILAMPEHYGFSDTTIPCYKGSMWRHRHPLPHEYASQNHQILMEVQKINNAAFPVRHPRSSPLCEGHLFFDELHPTTSAHEIIADKLDQFIQENY